PYVTTASNRVPFALLDTLIITIGGAWLVACGVEFARARRRGLPRAVLRIATRTVVWTAALYLLFLLAWGLNYRRVPLTDRVRFDASGVTSDGVRALAVATILQVNALYERAHENGWPPYGGIDVALAGAFDH